ncbi:MCP methyltransferase, CheR-type with Tpr repeats [Rippkaea orientalis PCC 8801]|uniref:MCP methyltransferase, CheR-type with Tpr repeats n=1 Tax=Rippkaea orientalis (strain PCC 8801 / RF-1) TaxID=41431 RepID=B7K4M9_RIPO1|nr:protein-glutamate O-methyltransferase CheR [Rippkaea orientalis]ACK65494.1 MCP methyltransferase, CheR-type with Tpr repeats [Rippkaea orientalis PCC 8801]
MNSEQTEIARLLKERVGLEESKIGTRQLSKAIANRQKACGCNDLPSYLKHLERSQREFQELVEEIVISETWFFRHYEAFNLLRKYVRSEWLPNHPQEKLRVLSLPCSTGEEAYSIAMTLFEVPLSPHQFEIDGMDISETALAKAKQGIYGSNSFRTHDFPEDKSFFTIGNDLYEVPPSVRNQVKFRQNNLLNTWLLQEPYQIIFCRHLLIYLDNASRNRAINILEKILCDRGLLFVGAVETTLLNSPPFRYMPHPSAFAYQKILDPAPSSPIKPPVVSSPSNLVTVKKRKPFPSNPSPSPESQQTQLSALKSARKLANQGQLSEATEQCQNYLSQNPADASAYLLLGEIEQAKGNIDKAQRYFQKALYLQPDYQEALMHLALLRESQGDAKGAAVLKNRIQRLQNP